MRDIPPDGLPLEHPAIEHLPEFICRVNPNSLVSACRNFNGSIAKWGEQRLMAYRSEDYAGMNRIALAKMDEEFGVTGTEFVAIPEETGVHFEDPRLAVIANRLYLIFAHVKFGIPNVCRQRMVELGTDLKISRDVDLPFGNAENGAVEKNWMPFELPGGDIGLVYSQRPHLIIDTVTTVGHQTQGLVQFKYGTRLSGRTPPLRIDADRYLAFFGGHVKHPYRGTRYHMGALLFSARAPFRVIAATPEPLVWGSEQSPTVFSSRPGAGHPICIYPAGAVRESEDEIIVSAAVNDSYTVLLRYSLKFLLWAMSPVDEQGGFVQ
jgi:predicted GH43/DUF377 family glycosyl hydrolase